MHIGIVTRSEADYALDLANGFRAEGAAVTLYMDHADIVAAVGDSSEPVGRLYESEALPRDCRVRLLRLPRMRDPKSLAVVRGLKRLLREDAVEVVHILLNPGEIWLALLASLVNDIPVVTTMIVPVANIGERLPAAVVWAINKLAASGSDILIVNSTAQVDLVKRLYGLSGNRIAYVPLSSRRRAASWREPPVQEEPHTILFFGRAQLQKGLEYLVRAQPFITRKVPDVRILISAHGEDLERCRQMIGDATRFEITEGIVTAATMATMFERAALVVLPYLTASTSGVLVTAFSFSKPVVASRVGALAEYVENEVTGVLVSPRDPEELAKAIVRLLLDDSLRHQMGNNARNWIVKANKASIEQTLAVYQRAIAIGRKKG